MIEKGKKWVKDKIIEILALLFAVASYCNGKELDWKLFCKIVFTLIFISMIVAMAFFRALYKEYQLYKVYKKRLRDRAEQQGDTPGFNYSLRKEKLREKFIKKCKKIIRKECGSLLWTIIVIVLVCFFNPQNAYAYWDNVKNITGFASKEEDSSDEERKDSAITVSMEIEEEKVEEIEEAIRKERDMEWRFILDEPTYSFELMSQMEKQVFFEVDKPFTEWGYYVQYTAAHWKEGKEGVNYLTIIDNDGNSYFTYTDMEDTFKDIVNVSSHFIYYDEWLNEAPHSSEYDKCIAGREKLNKVEVEGKTGCYELWWSLAKDYQYLALEYEHQTTNGDAILYYYANSIYCCMEALRYSISEEDYDMIYHFMVTRYHDISDDKCMVSQEFKIKASNIYSILVETDAKKRL